MARRIVGLATLAGVLGLACCILAAFLVPESRDESGENTLALFAAVAIALMLGGTLAMILHLNTWSRLPAEEKARWRSSLLVGGPIAAAFYFLKSEPPSGTRTSPTEKQG